MTHGWSRQLEGLGEGSGWGQQWDTVLGAASPLRGCGKRGSRALCLGIPGLVGICPLVLGWKKPMGRKAPETNTGCGVLGRR